MISDAERSRLHTGYKQAVRALNENKAEKLFIAEDCDADKILNPLMSTATEKNIEVLKVSTMSELGEMCGIDVGASCAVILKA